MTALMEIITYPDFQSPSKHCLKKKAENILKTTEGSSIGEEGNRNGRRKKLINKKFKKTYLWSRWPHFGIWLAILDVCKSSRQTGQLALDTFSTHCSKQKRFMYNKSFFRADLTWAKWLCRYTYKTPQRQIFPSGPMPRCKMYDTSHTFDCDIDDQIFTAMQVCRSSTNSAWCHGVTGLHRNTVHIIDKFSV